jgi:hypothetical protein
MVGPPDTAIAFFRGADGIALGGFPRGTCFIPRKRPRLGIATDPSIFFVTAENHEPNQRMH